MIEAGEQRLIEQFVTHPPVKTLDERVLGWLSRGRIIPSCGEADSDLGFPNGGKSDSMLFFIWRT
jgi:hypothetical protein